ncbi:PKD1L1 [Acanthosepion pharaonis]|uniref:PKD1L1 n=1 Tax=Acanthosepion pharaonis TaxID=158019 RepID=A0A812ARM0_ACAPH|nr:PKD1L1 [Sepia pharaonis]
MTCIILVIVYIVFFSFFPYVFILTDLFHFFKSRNSTWEAIHSFGTSIVYVWSLLPKEGFHDEDDIYVTSSPRFSEYLSLSGTYILSLFAENGISQQTASLTIVIVCPVVDIVLDTTYGVDNHPVEISVQVHGGDDIGLNVTFGDGSSQHLTSDQLQQLPDYFLHPFHTDQGLPLHHIILKHLYSTPGSYPLQITVSNSMSLIMRNSTIVVEEAITGLTLVSNSSRIMSIDDTVTISSSVKTGRNISFEWKCYPSHAFMDVVSFERSSKLTVTFNVMGIEYEIWVLVSNPWMKEPLKKLMHFAPVKRIESVFLKPMNNVYCAASLNMPDASENHVLFQATSSGTNVTYEFDYGDGSPVDHVNGKSSEIGPYDEATSRHIFRQEGVYTIKVTATNYLGNMTTTMAKPFCVQCPPRNLHIESKDHYKFGDNITFKAILNSGTNVSFDWNFGDQNQLINAGTSVTHRYLTTGRKKVTLTARNKVGVIKRFTDVFGFHEITGVTLKDSGNLHKIAVRESVRFIAQILPDIPHTFKYLCWDFGFDDSEKMHTDFYIDTVYKSVGKYLITVEAVNPFSKATSAPLEVHVFSKIRSLQILIRSSRLLNQPIIFEAYTYSGSDLVYEWDFGDGSPIQTDCIVYHTYNKSDEYLVKLTVSNEISNSSITKRLFILNDTCLAPEVNILGSKNQIIQRSKDVHIEPVVSVNCTKRYVNYTWKIFNTTTGNLIKLEKIDNSVFHERILFLPRRTLHYGNYSIQLEVRMNGTIVYSKVEIHLQVIPSTLHGVIDGGVMRFISRFSDEIRLDGSKSEDPDCLTKDHLRYQWSCNQLNNKNTTCFHTGYKIPLNKSILTFPGSELTTDINDFEFTLNISVPGLHSIKTSQVLRAIKEHNILPIKLMCITCMNNVMNANEKLILETICDGCASDPSLFIYEWKVEIINNGNYNRYVHAHDYGKCVEANGSSYKLLVLPNTTLVTTTMSTTTTTTTAPPTTTTTMSRIDTMPHQKNLPQRRGPQRGRVSYNRDVSSIQRLQEGVHEMKGGHGRQIPDFGKTIPVEKGKKNHDTIITATVKTFEEHIVSKSRRKITLDPNDTLSAMNGPSLVVKPGVLSQGRDYLITVNVTKKGNGTAPVFYGIAMSHFLINESPSLGSCNIRPAAGIEMHTNFSVFCYEWKDEHQPLVYEVSYNLKKNQRKNLIYRGLNTLNATLKFMLPAGNAENGDKVFVYIAVMDSLGARTSVCYIPVTVQPIDQTLSSINVSVEKANKMLNDTLHGYLDEKDGRNARILVNLMAIRLNRLEPMDEAAKNKRWKRRHALLCVLDRLPVRDELETLQTVQAVEAVTLKSDESCCCYYLYLLFLYPPPSAMLPFLSLSPSMCLAVVSLTLPLFALLSFLSLSPLSALLPFLPLRAPRRCFSPSAFPPHRPPSLRASPPGRFSPSIVSLSLPPSLPYRCFSLSPPFSITLLFSPSVFSPLSTSLFLLSPPLSALLLSFLSL